MQPKAEAAPIVINGSEWISPAPLRASLSIYVVFFATIAAAIFLPDAVLWLPKHSSRSRSAALRTRAAPAISARDGGASPLP
jgi:hypothetical protein